jgi:hypothetical protein
MVAQIQSVGIDPGALPFGFRAGELSGMEAVDKQTANQLALQDSQLGNAIKEVEARRAQSDFSNPEMEQWRQQGILGKNKQDYATGELSYQTLDSNVKTKLAENLSKASTAEIEATINGLDQFTSVASSGNPLAMHQAISTLPPQYQRIVQQLGPEKAVQYARQLSDTIKEARKDSPETAYNHEITAELDRVSREKIAEGNNAATRYAADQRKVDSQASERKYDLGLLRATPESRLGIVKSAIQSRTHPYSGEPLSQEQLGKYEAMYAQDVATVNAKNNANTQNKPNLGEMGVKAFPQSNVGGGDSQKPRPPLSSFNEKKG